MLCKNCGKEIEENSSFCTECGQKVETDAVSKESNKFCKRCGAQMNANSKFCTKCGSSADGVNNNVSMNNKVSIRSCIGTSVLIAVILFIIPFIISLILNVVSGGRSYFGGVIWYIIKYLQITLPILIILFGPFILYLVKNNKSK